MRSVESVVGWICGCAATATQASPLPAESACAVRKRPEDRWFSRFRAAMDRLRTTAPAAPNPVFGRLTHEQWIQLNLRHAELHLGFHLPR